MKLSPLLSRTIANIIQVFRKSFHPIWTASMETEPPSTPCTGNRYRHSGIMRSLACHARRRSPASGQSLEVRAYSSLNIAGYFITPVFVPSQTAKASINLLRNSRVRSLESLPSASKRLVAPPIYASGCCMAGTSRNTSDCRR